MPTAFSALGQKHISPSMCRGRSTHCLQCAGGKMPTAFSAPEAKRKIFSSDALQAEKKMMKEALFFLNRANTKKHKYNTLLGGLFGAWWVKKLPYAHSADYKEKNRYFSWWMLKKRQRSRIFLPMPH